MCEMNLKDLQSDQQQQNHSKTEQDEVSKTQNKHSFTLSLISTPFFLTQPKIVFWI